MTRATRNDSPSPAPASEALQELDVLELAINVIQENLNGGKHFKVADRKQLLELLMLLRAERNPLCTSSGIPGPEATTPSLSEHTYVTGITDLHDSRKSKYVSTGAQTSPEAFIEHPPLTLPDIPGWSIERLSNQAAALHYENSLYGPITTLLSSLFPVSRNFMIKPQGLFRKIGMAPEPDDDELLTGLDPKGDRALAKFLHRSQRRGADPNITTDSYSGESGSIEYIPDYLVCKAYAYIHGDKLLAIVEIKKKDCNRKKAFAQIRNYIKTGSRVVGIAAKIIAFLIIADKVYMYEVDWSKTSSEDMEELPYTRTYHISSSQFLWDLHNIAVEHWNKPVVRLLPPKPSNPEDNQDVNPLYN